MAVVCLSPHIPSNKCRIASVNISIFHSLSTTVSVLLSRISVSSEPWLGLFFHLLLFLAIQFAVKYLCFPPP